MEYQIKRVKGHGEYRVDTNGTVYGKKGRPLKYSINYRGYCIINFYENHVRTGFGIHTLVAENFIPNPENKPTVNHIDGNKQNNNVENLEWATYEEQMYHAMHVLGFIPNKDKYKPVVGINIKQPNKILEFDCFSDAARYLENILNLKSAKAELWRVTTHQRKSCGGYRWYYKTEYDENIKNKYAS